VIDLRTTRLPLGLDELREQCYVNADAAEHWDDDEKVRTPACFT